MKEETNEKVYCKKCKWLKFTNKNWHGGYDYMCGHPSEIEYKDSGIRRRMEYGSHAEPKNKANDCKDYYKKKWYQ